MVLYGHVWFCVALNGFTQLCTIFVLVDHGDRLARVLYKTYIHIE